MDDAYLLFALGAILFLGACHKKTPPATTTATTAATGADGFAHGKS